MRWQKANEARSTELAIMIISYPTSASGIIVLLKTPTKYREFFPALFVKTTCFQLVSNFEQTRAITIFSQRTSYYCSYTMVMAKPIKALELHYPMIQFLIIIYIYKAVVYFGGKGCCCSIVIIVAPILQVLLHDRRGQLNMMVNDRASSVLIFWVHYTQSK